MARRKKMQGRSKGPSPIRRKNIYGRLIGYFVFYCILALGLGAAVSYGYRSLHQHPSFSVDTIVIEGASHGTENELVASLDWVKGKNFFALELEKIREQVLHHPFVAFSSVKGLLPRTLKVTVVERVPIGLVRKGNQIFVVDSQLIPFADVNKFEGPFDFPVIVGLDDTKNETKALQRGITTLQIIKNTSLLFWDYIETLDLSDEENMIVHLRSVKAPLYLGPEVIPENLKNYLAIAQRIEDTYPKLRYIELGFPNQIAIMPILAKDK